MTRTARTRVSRGVRSPYTIIMPLARSIIVAKDLNMPGCMILQCLTLVKLTTVKVYLNDHLDLFTTGKTAKDLS